MKFKSLEPGKLYTITWIDPEEDPRGHPGEATCKLFSHTYRFHSQKFIPFERRKISCLIFTVGEPPEYYHSFCIPESLILKVADAK